MQCMPTLGNYVGFLAREPEAEAERFEADRTLRLFFGVSRGDDWHDWGVVDGVGAGVSGGDLRRV